MQVIVSDTCCIIDLKEGELLALIFGLPYEFIIPEDLFEDELLSFSEEEKRLLVALGLSPQELDPGQVQLAYDHRQAAKALTVKDCYALALAQTTDDSILLTGDRNLRKRSESLSIETHGVIWALDRMLEKSCCSAQQALIALEQWKTNPSVFLPDDQLDFRIRRLRSQARNS